MACFATSIAANHRFRDRQIGSTMRMSCDGPHVATATECAISSGPTVKALVILPHMHRRNFHERPCFLGSCAYHLVFQSASCQRSLGSKEGQGFRTTGLELRGVPAFSHHPDYSHPPHPVNVENAQAGSALDVSTSVVAVAVRGVAEHALPSRFEVEASSDILRKVCNLDNRLGPAHVTSATLPRLEDGTTTTTHLQSRNQDIRLE